MIAALAIALLSSPTDPLPFAPPIDRPLRYRETEHRRAPDGGDLRFTLTEEVSYARDGAGYVMTIRALSADAQAPGPAAAIFEAAMRPMLGVPVKLHLSPAGDPGELVDEDATWARIVAALQAAAHALPPDDPPEHRTMIERTAHGFATLAPAAREAMIKAPAVALLGLAVPDLAIGDTAPLRESVDTPFGPALPSTGTIRRDPDSDGARHYRRDLVTSADAAVRLAAALRAKAAKADPQAQRQIEQQAGMIERLHIHETGSITLTSSSGLLLASTQRTASVDPTGDRPISEQELLLLP